jgi:hypothetical protein
MPYVKEHKIKQIYQIQSNKQGTFVWTVTTLVCNLLIQMCPAKKSIDLFSSLLVVFGTLIFSFV